jgi:ferredoxin
VEGKSQSDSWTSICKRLTVFSDRFSPSTVCLEEARLCGKDFASNKQTGPPLVFWPFPLSIAGFILDNRWPNAFLCRNRSWKRRCTKCGLCVSVCPSQWLHDDDTGHPPHMPAGPVSSACSASICAPTMLCRYCSSARMVSHTAPDGRNW